MSKYNFFTYKDNFKKYNDVQSICFYGVSHTQETTPYVSIMIPTYKRFELLKEAIESVLNQEGFNDYEIVIVDNDSDQTYQNDIINYLNRLNDSRISYYCNQQNIGVFGNWNRCIELARGKWMTILSDDDILFKNYLFEMTKVIQNFPDLDRVECKYIKFSDPANISLTTRQKIVHFIKCKLLFKYKWLDFKMYLVGCFTGPHAQLYKPSLALKLGGFNASFYPISDYVFNAYYLYKYKNAIQINQYLCGYRILCNATFKPITQIGIVKWDRQFANFLLTYNKNIIWYIYTKLDLTYKYILWKLKLSIWKRIVIKILFITNKFISIFLDRPR